MTTTPMTAATQALSGETIISLYQLDLTVLGEPSVIYFTKEMHNVTGTGYVSFMGRQYTSFDVEVSGFEWSGMGPMPQPTVSLSNVNLFMSGLILQYSDLIGATLSRLRTFARYLDDGSDASAASTSYMLDVFVVTQKTMHNKKQVEFRLSSALDQTGRELPNRLVLRDICGFRYRNWNPALGGGAGGFDYSKAVCPYTGGSSYDANGNSTTGPNDRCSKHFATGCKPRFGAGPYPMGAYPGVARNR